MSETLTGDVSGPTGLPSALESEDVLAVVRDAQQVVAETGLKLSASDAAQNLVTELQRRGAAIDNAKARREQQMALQIASLTKFHQPYFEKLATARALLVEAVTAYVPQLVFPKRSKTLHTPYGSVQIKESGGGIRKLTDENAVLADALLDRWAVMNLDTDQVTVYRRVALTAAEVDALRVQMRAEIKDDELAMLPDGLIVERPNATQIKAIAKELAELPDGMEIAPEEKKIVVTFNGMASSAIEAVDIIGEDYE